jgi:hypothetical protein
VSRELGGNWIVATITMKVATIIKEVAKIIHYAQLKRNVPALYSSEKGK